MQMALCSTRAPCGLRLAAAPRAGARRGALLAARTALVDSAIGASPTSGLKHLSEDAKTRATAAT